MIINGREIKFLRTVKANCMIADMCKDGEIKNLGILFDGGYRKSQETTAKFMAALSEGYETNKAFQDPEYKPHPLSVDEALCLEDDVFADLFLEAVDVFGLEKATVETAEEPKSKKKGEAKR